MNYFAGNFVEARYMSSDRSMVQAYFNDNNLNSVVNIYTTIDNTDYTELLKIVTVEDIERTTQEHNKNTTSVLLKLAEQEYKRQGIDVTGNSLLGIVNTVFNFNAETDIDFLFNLKLKCFELQKVKESKNTVLKAQLRTAKNPLEVIEVTKQITQG